MASILHMDLGQGSQIRVPVGQLGGIGVHAMHGNHPLFQGLFGP